MIVLSNNMFKRKKTLYISRDAPNGEGSGLQPGSSTPNKIKKKDTGFVDKMMSQASRDLSFS